MGGIDENSVSLFSVPTRYTLCFVKVATWSVNYLISVCSKPQVHRYLPRGYYYSYRNEQIDNNISG